MHSARKSWKTYAVGAAALAALLSTTACEGDDAAKGGGSTTPTASATESEKPSKPAEDKTDKPAPDESKDSGSGGGDGKGDATEDPSNSICSGDGQGPYGSVESVTFGGEMPNTVMGLVLGHYQCEGGETEPTFVPDSATGAATDVVLDEAKLKVVVSGDLAKRLGTKTPDVNSFVEELAEMQDEGKLEGRKAPQFYFQSDAANPDAPEGGDTKIVYLHQISTVIE